MAAAGTLAAPQSTTTEELPRQKPAPANITSGNRIDEHDADYARLHAATVARLQASIRRYVRDLRSSGHDARKQMAAAQSFVQRHTRLLREAYAAGWREGLRDYYDGGVSARGGKLPHDISTVPDDRQMGKRLSFYAPSVAKMAAEGLRALHASHLQQQQAAATAKLSESILLYSPDQQRDSHGKWTYEGRVKRVGELKGKIAAHQAKINALKGVKSKEATAERAEHRAAIKGHRAEIAEHRAAMKEEKEAPKRKAEELKAAAQKRLDEAKARKTTAEHEYAAAEKAAAEKATKNAAEITRLYGEHSRAQREADRTREAAEEAILEERARANGEAAKSATAKKLYQKMLAAEQPMKDARRAHEEAAARLKESDAKWQELKQRYMPNWITPAWHDQLMKSQPDYKAAYREYSKDMSAEYKAKLALWRKEATYKGAREKLAGKIKDADIHAHPLHAPARAALAAVTAQLGEATGSTALRAAQLARAKAQNELNDAELAFKFPAWKYTLHSAPINPARYTDPQQWPNDVLARAMAAGQGNKDVHKGDLALLELQRAQGFDAKPDIISEAELEMHVKAGEVQLWRGDSKISHTDNLMAGDYHAGLGIRGNGTYTQQHEYQGKATAMSYAKDHSDGVIMRMTVKKGARVIDYADLKAQAKAAATKADEAVKAAQASGDKAALKTARTLKWLATSDSSRFAVALGYDAVRILPQGQWIILNRTAIRISHQIRDK